MKHHAQTIRNPPGPAVVACCALLSFGWCLTVSARVIEVGLSVQNGKVAAITPTSGTREIDLGVGEMVLSSASKGMNGVVISSARLLGFSSETMTWHERSLDLNEQVMDKRVYATFSLIRTNQRLHAFRATIGRWVEEHLGPNEEVKTTRGAGHVIAVVTNERVLGFSAFAGGVLYQGPLLRREGACDGW